MILITRKVAMEIKPWSLDHADSQPIKPENTDQQTVPFIAQALADLSGCQPAKCLTSAVVPVGLSAAFDRWAWTHGVATLNMTDLITVHTFGGRGSPSF